MPEQTRIPERQHSMRRADWSRIFFFDRMPLRTAGAGMCARRRSHFRSLRRKKVTKKRATPLSVSLRCATGSLWCSRRAGSAQTRFAQTARGPDPLCACAPRHGQRGLGAKQPFGPSLRSASARAWARRRHWGRITMQRSETRAQTPIPEQKARPHSPLHPGRASCREEPAAEKNIERKWPLALYGYALIAINFDLNELE